MDEGPAGGGGAGGKLPTHPVVTARVLGPPAQSHRG